jgi:AmmeMemoRadiSam system protein A
MARAAALRDPRFPPVMPEEVPELEIEISVLGLPEPVAHLEEVQIGRHGLLIEGRGRRGLLLPQVASERDWLASTFAEQTCSKAGLEMNAYLDEDVDLYKFEAEVFNEKDT